MRTSPEVGGSDEALSQVGALVEAYRVHTPAHLSYALHVRGQAERLAGRAADALASQRESLAAAPDDPTHRMRVLPEIGLVQVTLGHPTEALASFDEALVLLDAHESATTPLRAETWLGKGQALWTLRRVADAQPWFAKADAFWREFDAGNPGAGEAALWLARTEPRPGRR